jgi:hypothetical protein
MPIANGFPSALTTRSDGTKDAEGLFNGRSFQYVPFLFCSVQRVNSAFLRFDAAENPATLRSVGIRNATSNRWVRRHRQENFLCPTARQTRLKGDEIAMSPAYLEKLNDLQRWRSNTAADLLTAILRGVCKASATPLPGALLVVVPPQPKPPPADEGLLI